MVKLDGITNRKVIPQAIIKKPIAVTMKNRKVKRPNLAHTSRYI